MQDLIKKERVLKEFLHLVSIYSPTFHEEGVAEYVKEKLISLGLSLYCDENYKQYGGNAPAIIAKLPGTIPGEGITLAAHMDVVEPNKGVVPTQKGDKIVTDGTTTLGADDKAGITAIFELLQVVVEKDLPHKDIFVIITPAEEGGMFGAKSIDWDAIPKDLYPAKNMLVLDSSGVAGSIVHTAPTSYHFKCTIHGKKAHAGVAPEEGISSIQIASKIIAQFPLLRINEKTTANIGTIQSTFPSNVVPDACFFEGEVRCLDDAGVKAVLQQYENILRTETQKAGTTYSFEYTCEYPPLVSRDNFAFANNVAQFYEKRGIPPHLHATGGGSDGNIYAAEGFNVVLLCVGMENAHTTQEQLDIPSLLQTTQVLVDFVTS